MNLIVCDTAMLSRLLFATATAFCALKGRYGSASSKLFDLEVNTNTSNESFYVENIPGDVVYGYFPETLVLDGPSCGSPATGLPLTQSQNASQMLMHHSGSTHSISTAVDGRFDDRGRMGDDGPSDSQRQTLSHVPARARPSTGGSATRARAT